MRHGSSPCAGRTGTDRGPGSARPSWHAPLRGGADLAAFALVRAAQPKNGVRTQVEALVDVDAEITNVVIHDNGRPRSVRSISTGGWLITDTIAERLGMSYEQAETLKFEAAARGQTAASYGTSVFGDDQTVTTTEHPAAFIIDSLSASLVSDVRTSLDYFLTSSLPHFLPRRRRPVTGGSHRRRLAHPGTTEAPCCRLRIPVEFATPSAGLAHAGKLGDAEHQLSVAIGLCLNEVK